MIYFIILRARLQGSPPSWKSDPPSGAGSNRGRPVFAAGRPPLVPGLV